MFDQTEQKIAELRAGCKSCFESKAFRYGLKSLGPVVARKPNLEVYTDRDRRIGSTPDYVIRGLRNLKRIFGENGIGKFDLEAFLDLATGEFVLTFSKLFYLLSPLSQWQYWEFMRMMRRVGILRVKYPKTEHISVSGNPDGGEWGMKQKRWTTEIRIKPHIARLNELLGNLENLKEVIPGMETAWVAPPPHPGGLEIGTKQVEYFRKLTSNTDPVQLPPVQPYWLPIDRIVNRHEEVGKWHQLLVGRPWADRMFDICCWVAGKANPYYNRDCDRRKNRVPVYLESLFKGCLGFYSVDPGSWSFRHEDLFYGHHWISVCEADIRRLAGDITHHQYLKGMNLLEDAGILHRTYDHTLGRGKRLFIRLDYDRILWVLANIDEWKRDKKGKAEEIISEALRFLDNAKKADFAGPGSMTVNRAFNIPESNQHPGDWQDASHPQSPVAGEMVSFGAFLKELPASPGKAFQFKTGAPATVRPSPVLIPGAKSLAETVFTGPIDREGAQITHWLARMFSRPAITIDVMSRVQRLRHLPGHQKLTYKNLEQYEAHVYGRTAHGSNLPDWIFNLIDDQVNNLVSCEDATEALDHQTEGIELLLKSWGKHISVALARLPLGDYQMDAYDLAELRQTADEWRQRMKQLELAPWKFLDWVLPGGRHSRWRLGIGGVPSLEDISPGLFLFAHKMNWPAQVTRGVLAPAVRKALAELPAFFAVTEPICGWAALLEMSPDQKEILRSKGQQQIDRASRNVNKAISFDADLNTHIGPGKKFYAEDFVDNPPASLESRPSSTS